MDTVVAVVVVAAVVVVVVCLLVTTHAYAHKGLPPAAIGLL